MAKPEIKAMRQDSEMTQEIDTAKAIVRYLDESVVNLDAQITAKLIHARSKAVTAISVRTSMPTASHQILQLLNSYLHNHRALASTAMVCSAAFIAFLVTEQVSSQQTIEQGDAFLLGSELPPEAFLDKGFDQWLDHTSQH